MSRLTERNQISTWFDILAYLALGATIILIPFRDRLTLTARPFDPIYRDYTDFLLFASDLFVGLTLLFWLISLLLRPRRLTAGPLFLSLPMAGLIVMAWVSVLSSVDAPLSIYHAARLVLLADLYL